MESKGPVQLLWGQLQHGVAVSARHGDDEIGFCRESARDLASCELRRIAAQALEYGGCVRVHRVADDCTSAGARCAEIFGRQLSAVHRRKPFSRWRPTDVARAHEEDVQRASYPRSMDVCLLPRTEYQPLSGAVLVAWRPRGHRFDRLLCAASALRPFSDGREGKPPSP